MALATAANVRDYIPSLTGTAEDARLASLVTRAGAQFASWCGYPRPSATSEPTLESTTYTLYLDSPGDVVLYLPRPLTAVSLLADDVLRVYGSDTQSASTDYETQAEIGALVLKTTGSKRTAFSDRGTFRAIKVAFTAGFATVPSVLTEACCLQVAHVWMSRPRIGKEQVSEQGRSASVANLSLLPEVQERLRPFRLAYALGLG